MDFPVCLLDEEGRDGIGNERRDPVCLRFSLYQGANLLVLSGASYRGQAERHGASQQASCQSQKPRRPGFQKFPGGDFACLLPINCEKRGEPTEGYYQFVSSFTGPFHIPSGSDFQSASTRAGCSVLVPVFSDFAARIGFDACVGIEYHRRPSVCVIDGPMGNAWIIRIAGFGEVDPN